MLLLRPRSRPNERRKLTFELDEKPGDPHHPRRPVADRSNPDLSVNAQPSARCSKTMGPHPRTRFCTAWPNCRRSTTWWRCRKPVVQARIVFPLLRVQLAVSGKGNRERVSRKRSQVLPDSFAGVRIRKAAPVEAHRSGIRLTVKRPPCSAIVTSLKRNGRGARLQ